MIDVNLYNNADDEVGAQVLGGSAECEMRFISLSVGPLGVILKSAEQARKIASALQVAAAQMDKLESVQP